ncbi:cytochrome c peroxidase [Myroides gitamensis]|uniref:Cytochrome c551 peroxidase n=1 Tax=Myroides odoratus TaxID=256 RepID=A0A378U605_MYROD|nr:cytochrome-c peroxidase [Myroides odoratus]MCS4237726.1 cytochrome c peroxidase [Myroides odoratus]MDH6601530.1 cytochrome c peroxidase [Myroides gitamensis]QQU02751.1 cytochrome-c peroxidase [Myroides odoratus]STZ70024.1 Cytochrome c551 peroxidase precursor [Myroides odoratus]
MSKKVILFAVLSMFIGCKKDKSNAFEFVQKGNSELFTQAQTFFQPISSVELPALDSTKVALGKHLYFDTRLSKEGNISCNSCHNLNTYGVDNLAFSPGDDGSLGGRNSPTVFHAALHSMQFWDGRAKDVEEQAGGPILNPVEHNIKDEKELEERLRKVDLYKEMFAAVYQTDRQPITFKNITNAIGAFERTLMPASRFDAYLEGDRDALTAQEQRGLEAFMTVGCTTCHSGVALGGQMFQKFGLYGDYWVETKSDKVDKGLADLSKKETENYFFKVPGLRNIAHTGPYFHDGSVQDLKEAVRIMASLQTNITLTQEQIEDITVFLGSLSSDIPEEVKKSPF